MKIHHSVKKNIDSDSLLYEAISLIQTAEEAKKFFNDLCTPTEIQAMADRWLTVSPIKEGKPYRKIHEDTGVSVTTIGRVARCIMLGEGGYNLIYERQVDKNKGRHPSIKNQALKNRASK
ncbi:MAG: hypothetical protein A3F11_11935 [Gammaproteobacteria bacterium RIFCSPHIGHO2_12_FULL_37_14]|nr:MAG: hypothetical protein A3F11_11935 [Gammaproteobacteria bacterium RIFCSPHIGHO2_12_FULL_37_14]